jgi:hypothetical protein
LKAPIHEASADTQILYFHLKDHTEKAPDEVCTYATLTAAIKRNVQAHARPNLNAARKMAQREDGLVFGVVRNVGLKLVPPEDMHKELGKDRQRAGRAARRGLRKAATVDIMQLTPEARARQIAEATILEVQSQAAKAGTVKRLESKVQPEQRQMAIAEATLEMFR